MIPCPSLICALSGGAWLTTVCSLVGVPLGPGQLETAPQLFPGGVTPEGQLYQLLGQPAQGGKLILTASNGFFDPGTCVAVGTSSLPKVGDGELITPNYESLSSWKEEGALRWHFWVAKPGKVEARVFFTAAPTAAGSRITFTLGGESETVRVAGDERSGSPASWELSFEVTTPGEQLLEVRVATLEEDARDGVGALHAIALFGSAIDDDAQLLRARWRPAAVHGRYSSSQLPESRLWVMTTRSSCDTTSYSPITTPFGYFGASFEADRRTGGSVNFSMWAARNGGQAPPLEQMPHLLAAGSPEAEFSGFGHEGSGVKIRGWIPMPDRPYEVIQALRVESEGNYHTYHGYLWDHPSGKWQLYAVGREWSGGKERKHLSPGSFCEVPGPPNRQRTGDLVREVRRRGWFADEKGQWFAMDQFGGAQSEFANKQWYTTTEGEFAMATGGMRFFSSPAPESPAPLKTLPKFLTPESTRQLFVLPAKLGPTRVTAITTSSATVELSIADAGSGARGILYYGPIDCLTFAKRELHGTERNSEASKAGQADERTWSEEEELPPLRDGVQKVTLQGLERGKNYFYRLSVENQEGKVWGFQSGSFQTKE